MSQVSVLVADDNADMRAILTGEVRKRFHVRGALSNGKQLFDAASEGGVDVIVTDVRMPLLSGLDVLFALRMAGRFVPFVMISASPDLAAECLARGAAAFVSKMDIARDLIPAVVAALDGRTFISSTARAACGFPVHDEGVTPPWPFTPRPKPS